MLDWKGLRIALEKYYESILGTAYSTFIDFDVNENFGKPAWCDLNISPLIISNGTKISGLGGLLLDPEIGLACFFLEFKDENTTHTQISRVISFRSMLLPGPPFEKEINDSGDPKPEWRTLIHWVVRDSKQLLQWKKVISEIRNSNAYIEEISVDVILLETNNIEKVIAKHQLPRLLLNTRKILKMKGPDQIYNWRSADELVIKMLENLRPKIPEDLEHYYQDLLIYTEKQTKNLKFIPDEYEKRKPVQINYLSAENFRNITDRITLNLGPQTIPNAGGTDYVPSIAHIVSGPNGTGKTTLCEALEFALVGCSERMYKFRIEPQNYRKEPQAYLEYLKPIEDQDSTPKVGLSENKHVLFEVKCDKDPKNEKVSSKLRGLKDAMLSQERLRKFANLSADDFSGEVMRDYSPLSNQVRSFLELNLNLANEKKQEILRKFGLHAGYKILKTAQITYIHNLWKARLPEIDKNLLDNLKIFDHIANIPKVIGFGKILSELKEVLESRNKPPDLDEAVNINIWISWLKSYNEIVGKLKEWYEPIRERAIKWNENKRLEDLMLWAEWLKKKSKIRPTDKKLEKDLNGKLQTLNKERDKLVKRGQLLNQRLDHFKNISSFLNQRWLPEYPNVCPTCDTKFEDEKGGLSVIIENLKLGLTKEQEDLRKSYSNSSNIIREVQDELTKLGASRFSLSEEARSEVTEILDTLHPGYENLEEILMDNEKLAVIRKRTESLMKGINIPLPLIEPETLARDSASQAENDLKAMGKTWRDPQLWNKLKNILDRALAQIVKKHLPNTIGSLWWEIAMCLTPGSWLPTYLNLEIKVENEKSSQLMVTDKRALYVLNSAEMNIAGLAWFICRYILEGRWKYAFIVIDDPDQDMDEVTYREFCRFMYTFLFLHKARRESWSLVLLQHQEDRATIAAKALYGVIHKLGWDSKSAPKLLETMKLEQGIWEIPPLKKAFVAS